MSKKKDPAVFEGLVLFGIWTIIFMLHHMNKGTGTAFSSVGNRWRSNAIAHMDQVGNQSKGAPAYRRETTYPELR